MKLKFDQLDDDLRFDEEHLIVQNMIPWLMEMGYKISYDSIDFLASVRKQRVAKL